jgi:hypothetical protein
MLNKYRTIVLGAMLGVGTLAFTGAGASAAAMLPLSAVASGDAQGVEGGIILANHKDGGHKKKWKKRRFSRHCDYEFGGCGHFYRHRHHRPHFGVPLIIGGGFGGYDYDDDYYDDYDDYDGGGLSSRHIRYCLNKYRSYNPRNNTWVSYSGRVKQCYSPYL